ncbi:MAG: hypothetical protein ACJ76S_00825 [Solirubrobacteraceae bacterium]|jgi:hypothetical protein
MSEAPGGREPEAQPGPDAEDATEEDELGYRDADEDSGYDERGEQSDENAGSSPAW